MKKYIIAYLIVCTALSILYLVGLAFFLTDREPGDKCEMTYMYEYPQYVRIFQEIDQEYPKYGLYAYGEGRTTKNARNMQFDGIPVLFIPGNAGSHQQVRSLSSVALRKALNSDTPFHFDYFTVDLNSEFSALYGPVLFDQLTYVLKSIDRIFDLYKSKPNPPKRIILIGHSVGGIVARKAIVALLKHNKHLVSILITLASPLVREPVYFDLYGALFYATSSFDDNTITSVSVAGGYSDMLVPTYLTKNEANYSINVVGSHVAKSWVESNHVQILWCKQLVLAINRALFDSVDWKTKQISTDHIFVQKVFEHHLVYNSGSKVGFTANAENVTRFDYKGQWIENIKRQYSVEFKNGVKQPHWYMIGITSQPTYEKVTILAINLEVTNWIFACNAAYPSHGSRVCLEGEHLSQYSEIFPTVRFKRRLITVNLHEIRRRNKEYTHVVFRALPTSEPITFHVDTYGSHERETTVNLPRLSVNKHVVMDYTPENALRFDLIFPDLKDPLQIYKLYVEPIKCDHQHHHAVGSLIVPWANESVHSYFTDTLSKPFILRLQNPKTDGVEDARVRLILEPTCVYRISIRLHLFGIFGQIARYYSTFLISTLAVVFLLALQYQIHQMGETRTVPIFFSAMFGGLKQIWILFAWYFIVMAFPNYIPRPEFRIFRNDVYMGLAMLVLFAVSFVIGLILVAFYCVSLFTLESTVHKFTLKLLAKTVTLTIHFSDYFVTFLQKVPFLVTIALIVLSCSTCGGLALLVGLVFYFLKLTQMSQDYVEQVAWFIIKKLLRKIKCTDRKPKGNRNTKEETENDEQKDSIQETTEETANSEINDNINNIIDTNNALFFHSSLFFIWVFVAALNMPTVLTWAHNFKYSRNLSPDESLIPGLIFSLGGFFLWQFDLPRTDRKFVDLLRMIIMSLIPVCLFYATVSVYRLNYVMTFLFVLILLQQSFAPRTRETEKIPDETNKDKYDELKMKID